MNAGAAKALVFDAICLKYKPESKSLSQTRNRRISQVLLQKKNYFQIFSLAENYHLDLVVLAEKYRKLQAQNHPDNFASSSEQEKMLAVQSTSLINEAHETLTSPQKRAAYLLTLHDIDVTQVNQAELSPELLLEQIQLREELEEIPRVELSLESLSSMKIEIEFKANSSQESFAKQMDAKQFLEAKANYYEMQYYYKLILEIDAIEEGLLGY